VRAWWQAGAHHAAGDLDEQFPQGSGLNASGRSGFERFYRATPTGGSDDSDFQFGPQAPAAIVACVVLIGLGLSFYLRDSGDAAHHIACSEGSEGTYGIH
jgi:hypothetical protein